MFHTLLSYALQRYEKKRKMKSENQKKHIANLSSRKTHCFFVFRFFSLSLQSKMIFT